MPTRMTRDQAAADQADRNIASTIANIIADSGYRSRNGATANRWRDVVLKLSIVRVILEDLRNSER